MHCIGLTLRCGLRAQCCTCESRLQALLSRTAVLSWNTHNNTRTYSAVPCAPSPTHTGTAYTTRHDCLHKQGLLHMSLRLRGGGQWGKSKRASTAFGTPLAICASPTGTEPATQLGQLYGDGGHLPCRSLSALQIEHQCLSCGPLLGSIARPHSPKWQSGQGMVQESQKARGAPTERDRGRLASALRRRAPRGRSV